MGESYQEARLLNRTVDFYFILDLRKPLLPVMNGAGWIDEIHHKWIILILCKIERKQVFVEAHCMYGGGVEGEFDTSALKPGCGNCTLGSVIYSIASKSDSQSCDGG